MNNRRFFPVSIALVAFLTIMALALSSCAGGSTSSSGSAPAANAKASTSGSGSISTPNTGGSTSKAGSAPAAAGIGACSNAWLPVVAGASWTYGLTGPANMTITVSMPAVHTAGFTEQTVFKITGVPDITRSGDWKCHQGALTNLDPLSSTFGNPTAKTTYQTTSMVGPSLPAQAKAGDSWKQTYTVGITSVEGTVTVQGSESVSQSCTAIGMESVTVAAGTFNAMHVHCTASNSTIINKQNQPVPIVTTSQADKWYAANVGLVKSDDQGSVSQGKTNSSVLALTAYTIP